MYSNTKVNSTIFAAGSAAVMSLVCTLAIATAFVPQQTVKFQDLNMNSPAGVAALYQRIHEAAKHVCFGEWDKDPIKVRRAEDCAIEAEARAVSRVDVPALTAYYQVKSGRQVLTASLTK